MIEIETLKCDLASLMKKYPKGFLFSKQAAEFIGVTDEILINWIKQSQTRFVKTSLGYRISVQDFFELINSNINLSAQSEMTETQLAKYLNVDLKLVNELLDNWMVPFVFKNEVVVFIKNDIDKWIMSLIGPILKDLLKAKHEEIDQDLK